MENKELIGQIRQRLEILYQMFEQLEQGGGSSGEGYSKAETNALLAKKANKSDVYTKNNTYNKVEINSQIGGAIADLDVSQTETSDHYIDYIAQENGLIVPHSKLSSTVPTTGDSTLITSGAVKTALDSKVNISAIAPNAWSPVIIHDHSVDDIDIQTGGCTKIGKLCTASIRFKVKANGSIAAGQAVLQGLPAPVCTMSGTGNSCIAVSSNIGGNWALTSDGIIIYLSSNSAAIPSSTMVIVSCTYLCV